MLRLGVGCCRCGCRRNQIQGGGPVWQAQNPLAEGMRVTLTLLLCAACWPLPPHQPPPLTQGPLRTDLQPSQPATLCSHGVLRCAMCDPTPLCLLCGGLSLGAALTTRILQCPANTSVLQSCGTHRRKAQDGTDSTSQPRRAVGAVAADACEHLGVWLQRNAPDSTRAQSTCPHNTSTRKSHHN